MAERGFDSQQMTLASVVELVYTADLKSAGLGIEGSSPSSRTILKETNMKDKDIRSQLLKGGNVKPPVVPVVRRKPFSPVIVERLNRKPV